MPLVTRFDTPGSLRDAPAGSPFYDAWHARIDGLLGDGQLGSGDVGETYNPARKDVTVVGAKHLVWMSFPRRQFVANFRDDHPAAYRAADANTASNREKQEEYCEWRAVRKNNKIVKVTFTTETPDYWELLFQTEPNTVVRLYNELLGETSIVAADLVSGGRYNKHNRWNTDKGMIHLNVDFLDNTLSAALGLARNCADLRGPGQPHFRDNYDLQEERRQEPTSADPRVTMDGNTLVRRGLAVSLREPIGLYIAGWNDAGFTKPNGKPVENYWKIVRGSPGAVLRLEYEVPAAKGFVVGDIRIGGRPIEFGGQIAEQVAVVIAGIAGTPRP